MIQLLMIADDFTGALDSGVQLAAFGAKTAVITDASSDWTRIAREADVLVVDAETRHSPIIRPQNCLWRGRWRLTNKAIYTISQRRNGVWGAWPVKITVSRAPISSFPPRAPTG